MTYWGNEIKLLSGRTPDFAVSQTVIWLESRLHSGHIMANKIMRAGYYWSTMETYYHHHSRTCHKCQIYADKVHVPPIPLNILTAPWSFAMWGINMFGEIKPTASNGHRSILVAIDYFTKWVEDASFASVTKNFIARFIKNNLIFQYTSLRESSPTMEPTSIMP